MADSSFAGANVDFSSANGSTFAELFDLVNTITYALSDSVVTVAANTVGATTTGNAYSNGIFGANTIFAKTELRGGTVDSSANLNITSISIFNANAHFLGQLTLDGNLVSDSITIANNTISVNSLNDDLILSANGTGIISAANTKIRNLATPTANSDAVNLEYIASITNVYDKKSDFEAGNPDSSINVASISGFFAPNDGGGVVVNRANSEPTHNLKIEDSGNTFWEYSRNTPFNIIQVGARPSSNTYAANNVTAFNNLVSYLTTEYGGGTIYIPQGTFHFNNTLSISNNISIIGEGASSILSFSTATGKKGVEVATSNHNNIEKVYIKDCSNSAIFISGSKYFSVKDVRVSNVASANAELFLTSSTDGVIQNIRLGGGSSGEGLYIIGGCEKISATNIKSANSGTIGIDIRNSSKISLNNVNAENSGTVGLSSLNTDILLIDGLSVSNTVNSGVKIQSSSANCYVSINSYKAFRNGTTSGQNALEINSGAGTELFVSVDNTYDILPLSGTTSSVSETGTGIIQYHISNTVKFANSQVQFSKQDVFAQNSTPTLTSSGTTEIHLSDLDVSINPTTANANIKLSASIFYEASENGGFYIKRVVSGGANTDLLAPSSGVRTNVIAPFVHGTTDATTPETTTFSYYDSPATKNTVTYELWVKRGGATTFAFNRTITDSDNIVSERGVSSFNAKEM